MHVREQTSFYVPFQRQWSHDDRVKQYQGERRGEERGEGGVEERKGQTRRGRREGGGRGGDVCVYFISVTVPVGLDTSTCPLRWSPGPTILSRKC